MVAPRRLLFALGLFAASSAAILLIDIDTSVWWPLAMMIVRGVAMAFTFIPLQAASFATASRRRTRHASPRCG